MDSTKWLAIKYNIDQKLVLLIKGRSHAARVEKNPSGKPLTDAQRLIARIRARSTPEERKQTLARMRSETAEQWIARIKGGGA